MKRIGWKSVGLACALVCSGISAVALAEEDLTVVPGQSVGKARLGMTPAELEAAVGKPAERSAAGDRWEYRSGDKHVLRAIFAGGRVVQIEFTSPTYHTEGKLGLRNYRKFPDQFRRFRFQRQYLNLRYTFTRGGLTCYELNYDSTTDDPAPLTIGVVHAGDVPAQEPIPGAQWVAWGSL
jgi:hypothetical protein